MRQPGYTLVIVLLLAVVAAGGFWFYWQELNKPADETVTIPVDETVVEVAPRTGPIHPLELSAPPSESRELVPLPPLDDVDAYLRLELIGIFGDALDELLARETLIDRFVATVDNLPRSQVAERIRPLGQVAGTFTVDSDSANDTLVLSPANFERYTFLIEMLQFADVDSIVDAYRRYYPLFQEAYVKLGYPNGYFNDRLVEVIDHLLTTPTPVDPLALSRPHVLYEYADAELEALSSGQKLLLRIGDEHANVLRQTLIDFRERIASDQSR
jgi:hypothetical protein